jgi:hypothetical protein
MMCRCARLLMELLLEQPKQPFVRGVYIFHHPDSGLSLVLEDTVWLIFTTAAQSALTKPESYTFLFCSSFAIIGWCADARGR